MSDNFFCGLGTGMLVMWVFMVAVILGKNDYINTRAIELNQAQYNQASGEFEYTNNDLKYIMTGER